MEQSEEYAQLLDDVEYEETGDIDILIYKTIEYGTLFAKEQFGVVSVIKGENLIQNENNQKIEYK